MYFFFSNKVLFLKSSQISVAPTITHELILNIIYTAVYWACALKYVSNITHVCFVKIIIIKIVNNFDLALVDIYGVQSVNVRLLVVLGRKHVKKTTFQ